MRALLDPARSEIDQIRYRIVDDNVWPQALEIGANVNLGPFSGTKHWGRPGKCACRRRVRDHPVGKRDGEGGLSRR